MRDNFKILDSTYRECGMGCETLRVLIKSTKDRELKSLMTDIYKGYHDIKTVSRQIAVAHEIELKPIPRCVKCMAVMSSRMKTAKDKSSSKRAEMLIIGSTMGRVKTARNLRIYRNADDEIKKLARRLYNFEERNIDALEKYL